VCSEHCNGLDAIITYPEQSNGLGAIITYPEESNVIGAITCILKSLTV
jgi:hypothetical protein